MERVHEYRVSLTWSGNRGAGTRDYRAYGRDHVIESGSKPPLAGSSDPAFRGDPSRYSPEELLVASLAACHMLWYLHLCATHGVVVTEYRDRAEGRMKTEPDGSGRFTEVTLRPEVTLERGDPSVALQLHHDAHRMCFIASSVNFPVRHQPTVTSTETAATRRETSTRSVGAP